MKRARLPVAVHLLIYRGGKVLLLRRANTGWEDGRLSVPAGHVEAGETVTAAAIREAREEVGLDFAPEALRVVGVMHRRSAEDRIDFFLAAEIDRAEPRNLEPGKCSELAWADPVAPPPDVIPYIGAALRNHRAGRWFEEHGWE
jgi:8-oxo-dGTP pyrophosphatase MutT (NUDIX family)